MTEQRTCSSCGHELASEEAYCSRCGTFVGRPTDERTTGPTSKKRRNAWEVILDRLRASLAPRYRVEKLLGYGGMAGVYLAEETRLGRHVAIKVISPALMVDPAQAERFEQEARTTAQLDHPNIVTVYEVDERDDLHFFTMTYVPGRTLSQVMHEASGPLELAVVQAWLGQIASALAYGHTRGVVHRDIKPGNVLLDASGKALVGDFGIAKVQDQEGLTRTGMLVGTPSYMSPEQCTTGKVTGASDQYSLGAVAFQMLTGEPPFSGPTMAVIQAHVHEHPRRIRELRPDCPEELEDAVLRMLAKRPEDRFPRLEAALDSLSGGPLRYDDPVRERMAELARWTETISLEVEPSTITEMPVSPGERFTVRAVPLGSDGTPFPDRRVEWSTLPGDVLEVGRDGQVLALKRGRASLVASSASGVSERLEVTVDLPSSTTPAAPPPETAPAGQPGPDATGEGIDEDWTMRLDQAADDSSATRVVSSGEISAPTPTSTPARAPSTPPPAGTDGGTSRAPAPPPSDRPAAATADARGRRGAVVGGGLVALLVVGGVGWALLQSGGPSTEPLAPVADGVEAIGETEPATPPAEGETLVTVDADAGQDEAAADEADDGGEAAEDPTPAAGPPATADTGPAPEPEPEPEPAEPLPGVLSVGGSLPNGAEITIRGEGIQRAMAGGSISLPPGTYALVGRADGYEAVSGSVVVPEGGRVGWSPNWVEIQPPPTAEDPEPPAPTGPTPAEDRAGVLQAVQAFAGAIEAQDPDRLRAAYPSIPASDLQRWQTFFETRGLRDLAVDAAPRGDPTLDGDRAEVRFDLTLRYTLPGATPPATAVPYEAVLVRSGDRWVIDRLGQMGD